MADSVRIGPTLIEIHIHGTDSVCSCPLCGTPSRRVHSHYDRAVHDLPWRGTPVVLMFSTRRFFCDAAVCTRRVFAEQLPGLAAPKARGSPRLDKALVNIAMECGGAPGSRLCSTLGISASGDTLLRRLRSSPASVVPPPRVIGIDDFAWKRGQRYGTLVVDHLTHRVIDVLPERTSESTQAWLSDHGDVKVVTRDRSSLYAGAITAALPGATQVADRWHLLLNAREAVKRMLDLRHREVREAGRSAVESIAGDSVGAPTPPIDTPSAAAFVLPEIETTPPTPERVVSPTKAQRLSSALRDRRVARYQQVLELNRQNIGAREIAKRLQMSRNTVKRFIGAGTFREHAHRHCRRAVDPFITRLKALWAQGIHNASELHRRIGAEGFKGARYAITRLVTDWRDPGENVSGPRHEPSSDAKTHQLESTLLAAAEGRHSSGTCRTESDREVVEVIPACA